MTYNRAAVKKWGPVFFIAAALAVLLLWSRCAEGPIEGYSEVKLGDLVKRAEVVLGPEPEGARWSAADLRAPDERGLGDEARAMLEAGAGASGLGKHASQRSVAELQTALDRAAGPEVDALTRRARAEAALVHALSSLGRPSEAFARLNLLDEETGRAVESAQALDQWQQSQAARLYFLDAVRAIAKAEKWAPASLVAVAERLGRTSQRASLGRVLQRRFLMDVLPKVAEASKSGSPAATVCTALFAEPSEDQKKLVAELLHMHPRAFSPELTADAGALAVKELQAALVGPWPPMERTLDKVAAAQRVWAEYLAFLQRADAKSVAEIADVKRAIDSTENPVGLALLHNERTGWSSLVQSAFVADAKEAALKLALLRAAGKGTDQVVDALTGGAFLIEGSTARSALTTVGESYPFVKAFAGAATPL